MAQVWARHGQRQRLNRGCQTMSGRQRHGDDYDYGQEEARICECGTIRDEMGDHVLSCQKSPWRTRIHDRVRDCLARQLRRMGATVDLERVAPQWSRKYRDSNGTDKIKTARIDGGRYDSGFE